MSGEIRILMIDDDDEDFIIIRDIIADAKHRRYHIDWAPSWEEGLAKVNEHVHDVYLVDYRLGVKSGLDLIRESKEAGSDAPFILLTGEDSPETDEKALQSGASDFLVKGTFNVQQLESAIRYSIEQNKNIREIKKLNADLEQRVNERTSELRIAMQELENSKAGLALALEEERRVNEMKSGFISMVSHEFRTPLATALSSLALIQKYNEQQETEKQLRHIERIRSSIKHLTDLMNDVLTVSKLEEGKVLVNPSAINIHEFVNEALQEMQQICKANQVIRYEHRGEAAITTDKKIIRHILLNLVSNAIKFSPEGQPIDVTSEVANDGLFTLKVQDYGIGIPVEDQRFLFERFFRSTNASNIQGTGLGLHIVSKNVELLNGKIDVKSRQNEGTTFIISFFPGTSDPFKTV